MCGIYCVYTDAPCSDVQSIIKEALSILASIKYILQHIMSGSDVTQTGTGGNYLRSCYLAPAVCLFKVDLGLSAVHMWTSEFIATFNVP